MENLKKEREQLRRLFNNCSQKLDIALQDKSTSKEQVLASLRQLEDKSQRLFSLDELIREHFFNSNPSESDVQQEFDQIEIYRDQIIKYRSDCEVLIQKIYKQDDQMSQTQSTAGDKNRKNFRLPKLEIKKFDGNVKNWIGFWGQFKKIHEDNDIELEDKFQYLLQATETGSVARNLIESFPPSGSNYQKAVDQMKARFARDEFLIEVHVRELLDLVLKQATKTKTGMTLANLYDNLETQLRALETLGVTTDKYAAMLYPLVESALPEELLKIWERHRSTNIHNESTILKPGDVNVGNSKSINNLSFLLDFIRKEVESEERINLARSSFIVEKHKVHNVTKGSHITQDQQEMYSASALYSANKKSSQTNIGKEGKTVPICIFCDKSHASQDCLKAQNLTLEEKKAKVINKRACYSCLKSNHTSRNCRAFIKCLICKKKHYPIMCADLPDNKESKTENNGERVDNVLTNDLCNDTFLQTVLVRLVNNNKSKVVRALLDSASQKSYVLSTCVKDLGYVKTGEQTIIQGVFGGIQKAPEKHRIFDVVIQSLNRNFEIELSIIEQNKICNLIPRLDDRSYVEYLKRKNIILNEVEVKNAPRDIELLLGADIFGRLLTGKIEVLENQLVAIETHFGWTVMGQQTINQSNTYFSGVTNCSLTDLWNLDLLGIKDPAEVKSKESHEEDTIRHFNDTIKVNEQGRYEIQLPWIEGRLKPSSNQHLAEVRLQTTTKNLVSLGKFDEYEKVLDDWERLGIIEQVSEEDDFGKKYLHYLPHHAVIKESSKFTKIRPVFDASAKDESGNSLNSCLETGPNLIELIPSLLLKFRLGIIGVTADIEKAFLQISISPQDRDCLRFLWWLDHTQNKKKIYRHCRVVFGVKPSPFLLSVTINYHLQHAPNNLKQTANKLKESFYVDNCITSVNSSEELEKFVRESKEIMSLGQFNLRDWVTNGGNENQDFENEHISVLGMLWNMKDDIIFCDLDTLTRSQSIARTRRGLLSAAQRIFDPIGFTCPFTLIPKLLLQQSWLLKIGWDSELPEELMKHFESWLKQVHFLHFCSIPRSISTKKRFCWDKTSLHTFCDSSKTAYASCVFLRLELDDIVLVQLIQAKSRVAPKNITIPRLELMACLIGVRLHESVMKVLALNNTQSYFWSDSTVALTWIRTKGIWKTFVENRIKEINKFTTTDQWRHVPGNKNPADVASRGCSAKCLMESKWWEGPQWLKEPQDSWPQSTFDKPQEVDEERRKVIICSVSLEKEFITKNFNYFSKYTQIIRMIAWMLRFYRSTSKRGLKVNGELVYEEIKEAEICIMKIIQKESFEDTTKLKNLQVFRDENGILRVRTRLILSEDPHDFKFPILLPSKHEIVEKLIFEQHRVNSHVGIQTLLCILREKYWVLRGRRTVKRAIAGCTVCKRFSSKFVDVPLAPLPKERINTTAAFQVTGIDLAGPLFLKGGEKVWIVLYTCAVYRAIHLELVKSLSTDSFILALRRFVARRGRVSVIFSDNGTNMVGANNLLRKVDWNQIAEFSSVKKIKWIFNPPTAAWWGGWWERLVRLVKDLLRRNLGRAIVNFEEMITILCDCEVVINSRPLTYVSENEDDLIPLSPSLFIQDLPNNETPDFDDIDRQHLVSRRRYLQRIRDNLRSRFRKEYLAELVHTGHKKTKLLKIGDVVYVASDNKKRLNWPLGRVLEVIPGKDGIGRVARVKVQQGTILRPLQRLHPLEISSEEDAKELLNSKNAASKDSDTGNSEPDEKETEDITHIPVTTRSGRVVSAPKRFGFM